jgi:methionyl aminopeptidase
MSIETPEDLAGIRHIGEIVRLTLDALEHAVRPGVTTAELDRVASDVATRHGAESAPRAVYGFPGTVLLSVNDEVVHGVPGARKLVDGDLISLDVTLQKDGYVADAARTVTVGQTSDAGRRLIACAAAAFDAALSVARAGTKVNEIGRAVEKEVTRRGFSVVKELCGHGVGRTIHEAPSVPNHFDRRQTDVLTDGLVLTIEPIITAGSPRVKTDADGWTIRTRDGRWAAHHEHTLLITNGDPVLLTA